MLPNFALCKADIGHIIDSPANEFIEFKIVNHHTS